MTVIYGDNHIIVINKIVSGVVQGDKIGDISLPEMVRQYLKDKYQEPGNVFIGITHRSDHPASGLVILVRASKALSRLDKMFKNNEVRKTYWAVVKSCPKQLEGGLIYYLVHNEEQNKSYTYNGEIPNNKKTVLSYKLAGRSGNYSLLKIDLKTGRHHQIRYQLTKMGYPIKGDLEYGSPRSNPDGSICLHARYVRSVHPVSKELMELNAPVPDSNLWRGFEMDI